jgi:hypothetical protein
MVTSAPGRPRVGIRERARVERQRPRSLRRQKPAIGGSTPVRKRPTTSSLARGRARHRRCPPRRRPRRRTRARPISISARRMGKARPPTIPEGAHRRCRGRPSSEGRERRPLRCRCRAPATTRSTRQTVATASQGPSTASKGAGQEATRAPVSPPPLRASRRLRLCRVLRPPRSSRTASRRSTRGPAARRHRQAQRPQVERRALSQSR